MFKPPWHPLCIEYMHICMFTLVRLVCVMTICAVEVCFYQPLNKQDPDSRAVLYVKTLNLVLSNIQ